MSREALFPVEISGVEACLICGAETGEPTVTPCACGPVHPNCAASAADLHCALCYKRYASETHNIPVYRLVFTAFKDTLLFLIFSAFVITSATLFIVLPSLLLHAPIDFMSILSLLYKVFVLVFTLIPPIGIIVVAIFLFESRNRSFSFRFLITISAIFIDTIYVMLFATVVNYNICEAKQQQWCVDLDTLNFYMISTALKSIESVVFIVNLLITLSWIVSMYYRNARKNSIKHVVCNKIDPVPVSV